MAQAEELLRWNTLHYFKWGDDSAGALTPLGRRSAPVWRNLRGKGGFTNSLFFVRGVGVVNILVPRCLLLRLRVPCRGHLEACLAVSCD